MVVREIYVVDGELLRQVGACEGAVFDGLCDALSSERIDTRGLPHEHGAGARVGNVKVEASLRETLLAVAVDGETDGGEARRQEGVDVDLPTIELQVVDPAADEPFTLY